jgi:hypothetical protein
MSFKTETKSPIVIKRNRASIEAKQALIEYRSQTRVPCTARYLYNALTSKARGQLICELRMDVLSWLTRLAVDDGFKSEDVAWRRKEKKYLTTRSDLVEFITEARRAMYLIKYIVLCDV